MQMEEAEAAEAEEGDSRMNMKSFRRCAFFCSCADAQHFDTQKIEFFHTKMIAISEEVAKAGEIGEMIV